MTNQDVPKSEQTGSQASQSKESLSTTGEQKRRYRRHPKPDEHAPEKPPSAYVLFSNKIREEVKGDNLSFTEIARLVGERWQKLSASEKEMFESHAAALKDRYNVQLAEYKKTDAYRQYMEYLADFKAKHGVGPKDNNDFKRPRLEPNHSSSLSAASQPDSVEGFPDMPSHIRRGSIGSTSTVSHHAGFSGPASTSALQLVTALPLMGDHERSTSPLASRERRQPGRFSTQSSMSEDTDPRSFDSTDALQRAVHLSLNTPSSDMSPMSTATARISGQEQQTLTLPTQPWSLTQGDVTARQHHSSTSPSLGSTRHNRQDEIVRSGYDSAAPPTTPHAGSMPISQLLGPSFGALSGITSPRILPPLRPQNEPPVVVPFGTPTGHPWQLEPGSLVQPSSHILQQYQDQQSKARTSESEAADTLAGLAGSNQRYDPAGPSRNRVQGPQF